MAHSVDDLVVIDMSSWDIYYIESPIPSTGPQRLLVLSLSLFSSQF